MTAQPTPRRHTTRIPLANAGIAVIAATLTLLWFPWVAVAQDLAKTATRHHALSLIGKPKLEQGFTHFDWVNPAAPKGGTLRLGAIGSFDSLNPFSVQGDAPDGMGLIDDPLMVSSLDEPSTQYCLVCEWVSYPEDFSSATFKLREAARFHDGKPITPEDVIFSLEAMKAAHPQFSFYYKNVVKAEKTGEHEVTFKFDSKGNRELPTIVGQLSVLPKHYWQSKGSNGEPRDLSKSTLDVPVGSGAYRVKNFETGRTIVYERVKDHWAKDLPVSLGLHNFDEISYTFFRDSIPAFESFKSGLLDSWNESSANRWNTQYEIDAVKKGMIKKETLAHKRVAGMQGFAFNLRRKQFQDPRVRQAFALAYNFEDANKSLFYSQYIRLGSFFDNSELAAKGVPQGRELEILKAFENELPPELFNTEWKNPVNLTPADFRKNLGEAAKLLQAAGWTSKAGVLTNATGEQLTVEFLLVQPDFERIVLPYVKDLEKLGVKATTRIVDSSQYKRRLDTFDFDMIVHSVGQSHSPGNEQRNYWGSAAATMNGSRNVIGINSNPIDRIIDQIVFAKDRDDLMASTRALDRVLLWGHYMVPQWHYPNDRVAIWDRFGRPKSLPSQSPASIMLYWWHDTEKAKAITAQKSQ